jgi:hypothetical protein
MSSVPYEIHPQAGLACTGSSHGVFTIGFPSRSTIRKIVISQTVGTPVNFTAAFYNRRDVTFLHDESESLSGTQHGQIGLLPPDLYRVTPDLFGIAGSLIYFAGVVDHNLGFLFFNQDTNVLGDQKGNQRLIYLRLSPSGSGAQEFSISLAGEIFS